MAKRLVHTDPRQEAAFHLARKDLGTWEWKNGHNPKVVQYFADVGHDWVEDDETAWCAAFVGAMLERSGLKSTRKLNARSYNDWGHEVALEDAMPGDIVVLTRGNPKGWLGHVGFYEGHDQSAIEVLGGNQGNQVNVRPYSRARLLSIRRMPDAMASPVQKQSVNHGRLKRLTDRIKKLLKRG